MKTPMIKYLVLAFIASLVAWHLYTGKARSRSWRVVTRDDDPAAYWFIVIVEVGLFFVTLFWVKK